MRVPTRGLARVNARVCEVRRYADAEVPAVVPMDPKLSRKLGLVSTICFITLGGLPHERSVFFAPENGDGGGGGSGDNKGNEQKPVPKHTDDDVNRIVAERVKKSTAEAAEAKAKLDELTKAQTEAQAKIDELELRGKSEADKARIAAEKAAKKIEEERELAVKGKADSDAKALASDTKLRSYVLSTSATQALIAAKVLPDGVKHAVRAFLDDVKIETDADHTITSIQFEGVAKTTLAEAAIEWLKKNPVFAPHVGGGGTRGGAGGTHGGRPLHELSSTELLELDAAQQRR